ncbi:TVP38/TMEM64 family protein [Chitinophaga japonensis]|uniref:TVP38/TMEM64 family membrane protein n=1 Tax=Chitinophaga japonensis TaxID=104662 RepID=A0A562T6S7_CHIJA|nr:VTT domain-containing protein [Chitinophaga japonensis]TWI89247.1 putative membrane protein YdjX (TVP38/TMEM64 family) [Chitinophaga japonensis]
MTKVITAQANNSTDSKLPYLFSLAIIAMLGLCYWLIPPFQEAVKEAFEVLTSKDRQRINDWVSQFGLLGPLILVVLMMVQMFLFVVPNVLVMLVAITCYGPVWGSLISLVGVFASSSLGYMIGRFLGPSIVNKFISVKTQEKIRGFIKAYGVPAIAITRLSSLSNDSLSFVAGILKMSYWKYILATLAGITPLVVLLAIYGKNGRIEKALIWIAAISLVLLVLYIIIDKRRKKRKHQP